MAFGHRTRAAAALLALGATAVLVYWGNGLMPHWPLMWFAPLPVLWFALRRPAWQAALVAAAAWMLGGLNLWDYLVRVLGAPPIAWFLDIGGAAAAFALGVLITRALARRGAVWAAWLALPAVWVSFEFGRNLLWSNGSAASIAYSQLNCLPFLQTASLAGPWGMAFVLMLFPTGLTLGGAAWRGNRAQAWRVLGATLGVVAGLLIFGALRLASPQPGPRVKVGLIASDANGGAQVEPPGAATAALLRTYAEQARRLAAQGARVVVMPEHLGVVRDGGVAAANAIFQPIANQTGAVLVVGVARQRANVAHNQARIYAPHVPVRTYAKEHLLDPYETARFAPGRTRTMLPPPGGGRGRWGVAICKDLDFTNPARAYGRAGVGLLLAPAWDFTVDRFWHGHIAVMRAVEDGFGMARAARRGYLTVADDRGRILAERRSSAAPFTTLLADVPTGHQWTPFLWLGDWWGWVSMALLAFRGGRAISSGSKAGAERPGNSAGRPAPGKRSGAAPSDASAGLGRAGVPGPAGA
jgi:apolipoprotein N-acyltransferase